MAKKKDSVALFEVIARSRAAQHEAGLDVPAWMGHGEQDQPAADKAPPSGPPRPPARAETVFATGDGRLTLSLNRVSCAVAALVLAGLLVVAFVLGRATAGGTASPQTEPAQGAAATPGPLKQMRFVADNPRVGGRYYLVIQGMQGTGGEREAAARDIVEYLAAEGVPADVGTYSGTPVQIVVWSLTGFDSPGGADAMAYVAEIERLGRAYMAGGGKYDFRQRDREGKLKPWFQRAAEP